MDEEMLAPVGGPTGYVYNIKNQMKDTRKFNNINFIFLHGTIKHKSIKKYIPKFIKEIRNKNRYLNMAKHIVNGGSYRTNIDFSQYDIVHFHSTYALYEVKDSLKGYTGKILLTSHSPKALHKEFIEDCISEKAYLKNKKMLDKLEIMDKYAFDRADYIIFPCEEAEEPYYNSWDKYTDVHKLNEKKYRYLLTGISQKTYELDRISIRKKYKIPENAFVICYVGRHNKTKGYDKAKIIGDTLLKRYKDIYFLIAGKEEPLCGISNERWIECGWTSISSSIINASDVFVLPNQETYFDLVMLEVLSLGKVIVTTRTGGNKYFEKIKCNGINFYDYNNVEEAVNILEKLYHSDMGKIQNLGMENYAIYKKYFTSKQFLNNYIELLENILCEN